MNFPKIKTLHETESFHLLDCGGLVGIKPLFTNVVVMPFTSDDQGLPLSVGVLKEPNPFREDGHHISLVTGTTDDEDGDLLSTAQRELYEETGFNVPDIAKWYYLGSVTSSKFVDHEQPCFAVDVTGITKEEPKTDGSPMEQSAEFKFIPANDVIKEKDIFIPGLFLKLFKYVLGMDIQTTSPDFEFGSTQGDNTQA
jgi:8-oxo-dGTP pyrophosphatase MutT (NUDIX family)